MDLLDEMKTAVGRNNYEVKTKCSNCNTSQMTKIKKGHLSKDVISNGKCGKCGCQTLEIVE